nr:MAG TPA: hypothetical protein [Caudoviricetes sp.]
MIYATLLHYASRVMSGVGTASSRRKEVKLKFI